MKVKPAQLKKIFVQRYRGEDYLAETIIIGNKPKFAKVKDKLISIVDSVGEYYPTIGLSRPYTFSSEKEFDDIIVKAKAETLDTLITKVSNQWKKYSHADEFENALCAADTIFTYYQDILGMTHYLFFVGSPDSGKSNKLCLFNVLAYRNFMSTDMTASNIYRHLGSVQECQGTICEDEADNLDEDNQRMKIYKNGYTKGFRVPRNDREGNTGNMLENGYFTYGWKAFAAERQPDSTIAKGFVSRVIPINCLSGTPKYDISEVLSPADDDLFVRLHDQLFEVRNLLFCYSLVHCFDKIENINLNISNREKQLFKPLIRLFQGTKTQEYLFKVTSHFVNKRRKQNVDSLLAFLYKMLDNMVKVDNQVIDSSEIWATIKLSLEGSSIPNKPMSWETSEFGILSQKGITEMIKDNFKAQNSTGRQSKRALVFSKTVMDQLRDKYEVNLEVQVTTDAADVINQGEESKSGLSDKTKVKSKSFTTDTTDTTDVTDVGGIGTEKERMTDTLSSSSCVPNNKASYPSSTPDFERVSEGLNTRRIKTDPSYVSLKLKKDDEGGERSEPTEEAGNE